MMKKMSKKQQAKRIEKARTALVEAYEELKEAKMLDEKYGTTVFSEEAMEDLEYRKENLAWLERKYK